MNRAIAAREPRKETVFNRPTSVMLADGQHLVRQEARRIIEAMEGFEVVGEAGDGVQLLEVLQTRVPDLLIVDISTPNLRDLEVVRKIKELQAQIKLIFLSMHEHQEYLNYALEQGAEGFIVKPNMDVELSPALEKIRQGGTFISPLASPLRQN
jgi:DNA-binding NarL/FixJ family response regulator